MKTDTKARYVSFKTVTNSGLKVRVIVEHLVNDEKQNENAIVICTIYLVSKSEWEVFERLNTRLSTFFTLRETDNYRVIMSRSQPIKYSTFKKISHIFETLNNE